MTRIIDKQSTQHRSARLAAGLAFSACLVLGTFVASASAQPHGGGGHGGGHGEGHGGGQQRYAHGGGGRGYYRAPPVVYGSPYGGSYYGAPYYPPPVVYIPGIGIGVW